MAATRRTASYRSAPRRSRALAAASARLAARVRQLRASLELTQQAAADLADIETKHFQLIESGTANPTLATLLAIAKALRVPVHELLV